jgi:hypothetical protein
MTTLAGSGRVETRCRAIHAADGRGRRRYIVILNWASTADARPRSSAALTTGRPWVTRYSTTAHCTIFWTTASIVQRPPRRCAAVSRVRFRALGISGTEEEQAAYHKVLACFRGFRDGSIRSALFLTSGCGLKLRVSHAAAQSNQRLGAAPFDRRDPGLPAPGRDVRGAPPLTLALHAASRSPETSRRPSRNRRSSVGNNSFRNGANDHPCQIRVRRVQRATGH